MFNTYIFDIDGTLVDSEYSVLKSLQLVLQKHYGIQKNLDELEFSLGIPGAKIMETLGVDPTEGLNFWHQELPPFRSTMKVYDGIDQTINELAARNDDIAIVTSKTDEEFQDEVAKLDFTKHINHVITASKTTKHKPNPEPLLYALNELNKNADEAIYFGDTIYDQKSAHGANMKFGLATWGAHDHGQFDDADFKLQKPTDILDLNEK